MTSAPLEITLPAEILDVLAERVAAILADRQPPTDDGWLRGATAIAAHLGATPSRVYALHAAGRIAPVVRDGSALVAKRSELDGWVRGGGGKRP